MKEKEWLSCNDPQAMLAFMRGKASDRKYRLFMLSCCDHIRHLLADKPYRHTVHIAERFVDGLASNSDLAAAHELAEQAALWGSSVGSIGPLWLAGWYVDAYAGASANASDPDAAAALALAVTMEKAQAAAEDLCVPWASALGVNPEVMASTLRDVFHTPYRGILMRAAWRTWNSSIAKKVARAIYDERAFDRMPILADALEEAGCTDADILNHCRQPGEHVRGCWVVDMILGKL